MKVVKLSTLKSGDASFEVELKGNGRVYEIPAGKTILGTGINPGYAMDVLPICLTAPRIPSFG